MKKLKITPRPTQTVSLKVPLDTLAQLQQIARARDLGFQSLLKLYIGEGVRSDLALVKKQQLVHETESALRQHFNGDPKLNAILRKLKKLAAAE